MPFIGYHANTELLVTSQGNVIREHFLEFLVDEYQGYQKVCYDLDQFVSCLACLLELDKEQCQQLMKGKLYLNNGFRLTFFSKHYFAVDYGYGAAHGFANFSNMNQVGYCECHYTEDNSIEDAINKAKDAKLTANEVSKVFIDIKLDGNNIGSPISAFLKQYKTDFFPTADDCPKEASKMAYDGIRGQWFEAMALGTTNAYDFDINGSYAFELSRLPNIKQGKWLESPVIPDGAVLGVATGTVRTESPFHPYLVKVGDESNFTPAGKFPNIMTLDAIKFQQKWHQGTFDIDNGFWFVPNKINKPPYAGMMNYLYNKKQLSTNKRFRTITTRIYSSMWGRTLMSYMEKGETVFGEQFNPLVGITVETNSRIHVAEALLNNNITPLAIMADGFITDKQVNLPLSNRLGDWKLSAQGRCIIAGSGAVTFEGDNPPEELALRYDSMIEQIKQNPDATEYTRYKYAPVTLGMVISQNRDLSTLGTIEKLPRTLTISNENKRFYTERPITGGDLVSGNIYESSPLDYSMIK